MHGASNPHLFRKVMLQEGLDGGDGGGGGGGTNASCQLNLRQVVSCQLIGC